MDPPDTTTIGYVIASGLVGIAGCIVYLGKSIHDILDMFEKQDNKENK